MHPSFALRVAFVLLAAGSSGVAASPTDSLDEAHVRAEVRRWEYVVLVRVTADGVDPVGYAETAALRAGGAVLDTVRTAVGPGHSDYRLLVRTRAADAISGVLREMRSVRGVLGASVSQLPETPTYAGGPDFISSYTAELGENPGDPRVVVRHDVPPVLDKRDLLETAPVPSGPATGNDGVGGFTLNVSELFRRMKEGSWRRREQRMKDAYLPVLPSQPGEAASLADPPR